MKVEAVLFDAGETLLLLDREAIVRACRAAGAEVDVPAVDRALLATRRAVDDELLPRLARGEAPPQHLLLGGRSVQEHALHLLVPDAARRLAALRDLAALDRVQRLWTLVPEDALPTLDALLARGLRLAVVSNSDGSVEGKLRREGLADRFEAVLDSHVEGFAKPDPRLFRRGVERLGLDPARCLYVGDIFSIDVAGARAAGLQGALLDRTGGAYETPDACLRVSSLRALLEVV